MSEHACLTVTRDNGNLGIMPKRVAGVSVMVKISPWHYLKKGKYSYF